ncbi:MAG: hypothetical protein ABIR55_03880 [Burkholderiaceae bacterium]
MNIDKQVMDVLRRHAPGLLPEAQESSIDLRNELRRQLAEVEGPELDRVKACRAMVVAVEDRQAKLRKDVDAAERDYGLARNALSDANDTYFRRRDAVWKALEGVPGPELVSFRLELDARIAASRSWARSWTGSFNKEIGSFLQEGNANSLRAYEQALLNSRALLDSAIHSGLEGAEAEAAIDAIRGQWPQIQVGKTEYITPPCQP